MCVDCPGSPKGINPGPGKRSQFVLCNRFTPKSRFHAARQAGLDQTFIDVSRPEGRRVPQPAGPLSPPRTSEHFLPQRVELTRQSFPCRRAPTGHHTCPRARPLWDGRARPASRPNTTYARATQHTAHGTQDTKHGAQRTAHSAPTHAHPTPHTCTQQAQCTQGEQARGVTRRRPPPRRPRLARSSSVIWPPHYRTPCTTPPAADWAPATAEAWAHFLVATTNHSGSPASGPLGLRSAHEMWAHP